MRVLVACEFSGIVRDEFAKRGHDAWSCDLIPSERPGNHLIKDCLEVIREGWDLMIAHPPCTYLCSSGLHWNKKYPERNKLTDEAVEFFKQLWNADISKIAIENPIGCISTRVRKPDQIIQPYNFGDDASKSTCLWLKNLPLLTNTNYVSPRIVNGYKRWSNQTPSGQDSRGPSKERSKERARTYQGIAKAMAEQWGQR